MRTLLRSIAVLSALSLPVLSAQASTTYTFTPTLTDLTTLNNVTGTFGSGSGPVSFNDPPGSFIDSLDIAANNNANGDEISVDFAFTAPGTGTGTLTGDANITGFYFYNYLVDYGSIQWDSASDTVNLSNGSTVDITLPTNRNGSPSDTNLSTCASGYACGSTNVTFTVTNNSLVDPPQTPEPSSLALLGTGILGAAGMIRRKLKV